MGTCAPLEMAFKLVLCPARMCLLARNSLVNEVPWVYSPKIVRTKEIARLAIIT